MMLEKISFPLKVLNEHGKDSARLPFPCTVKTV